MTTTIDSEQLTQLHHLCREGRLYEVEEWIQAGRPLQLAAPTTPSRRRQTSALEIALEAGNHSLVLLLLRSGYDPNLEPRCPLDLALRKRRWDLLDLLLDHGADPHDVDLNDLFDSYNSKLFERFRSLGVDLTDGHELAAALAYHSSNKPLYGFAKRHRRSDPKIQQELNIALAHHAGEGNEKGVLLCLWAGADPHAPAPSLRYSIGDDQDDEDDDEDRFIGFTAIEEACSHGHVAILERLAPDPKKDDFERLYCFAGNGRVIQLLARFAPPKRAGRVIHSHLTSLRLRSHFSTWGYGSWETIDTLTQLFKAGVRWTDSTADEIAAVRWTLVKISDHDFVEVMKFLATSDHVSEAIRKDLARTPAIRRRMKEVGFIPPSVGEDKQRERYERIRPTRSREVLAKFGVELPKPKKKAKEELSRISRVEWIGTRRRGATEVRLTREEMFERVWTTPVWKLAEEWGLSGRGLGKACKRLRVPVPPRGYWAKLRAGKRVRRAQLPALRAGQAEEIVVFCRAPEE